MKRILILVITTVISTLSSAANAASPTFQCSGQAEYNKIIIQKLTISSKSVMLRYSVNGGQSITANYITTEFLQRNGTTDNSKPAYLIGATKSGTSKDYDDIAMPHFGVYKSGLGSEIAFNYNSDRVFGTISCLQK